MYIFWLIMAVVLGIGEMMTTTFFLFWFAIGALVSCLVAIFIPSSTILAQVIVFAIVSVVLLIFTKPLVKKFINKDERQVSNYMANIGKKALVTTRISVKDSSGQVKLNGEVWSAIPENLSEIFEVGTEVTVTKVEGVKLVVKA